MGKSRKSVRRGGNRAASGVTHKGDFAVPGGDGGVNEIVEPRAGTIEAAVKIGTLDRVFGHFHVAIKVE
jgi:hypothetical protein